MERLASGTEATHDLMQDDLFAKVAQIVPGIRDEEEEEEFDIAAIMAKQKQQAAKIRQEAQQMRGNAGCAPFSWC